MARSVKVDLLLEASRYLRTAREAKRETQGVAESLDDAARSGDKTSTALDTTAREMSDAARAAAALDRRVDELRESLRGLAVQSALGGGGADLDKQMRAQESALRKATKARKLLPDMEGAGAEAAEKFGATFVARVGPLLARAPMGPAGAAIGAVLAVGVVPTLAAAVQGAVVGGVGAGGVIGGVMLASRDARVQAAGKQLGANLLSDLEDSGSRFVEPTLAGIRAIQRGWDDVSGDIDGALAAAARYVEPLAEGVANFARELAPGIRDAAEAAEPIVRVVSEELPEVGAALSDMLSSFSDDADSGAAALRAIFFTLENGIDTVTNVIDAFSAMFSVVVSISEKSAAVMEAVWGWIPGMGDAIRHGQEELRILQGDLDGTGEKGATGGEKAAGGIQKVEVAATTAAVQVETLSAAIARMAGENISAEQAQMRLEEAIDRATEAGRKNNDGIDRNTEKGRANRSLLVSLAEASNTTAEAIFKQTGSQELASAATERGRAAFLKSAAAMGVSKAEAKRLADQLFGIPKRVDSKIMVTANTQPALNSAKGIVARINNMHARIKVSAEPSGGYGGSAHTGDGYSTGMRWGGAFEHARDGLIGLRDAGIYSPAGPARYAFAEPATGGEAFIPRFGNRDRSLDILSTAARWYGAQVGPMSRAAAPAQPAGYSPAQLAAAVRAALAGVTVQMDGRTVGAVQGRQADLLGR